MKLYPLPPLWDARKFAARYDLNIDRDFYVNAEGQLVVFPTFRDDPPIFEPPDPPGPSEKELLEQRLADIEQRLKTVEERPNGIR